MNASFFWIFLPILMGSLLIFLRQGQAHLPAVFVTIGFLSIIYCGGHGLIPNDGSVKVPASAEAYPRLPNKKSKKYLLQKNNELEYWLVPALRPPY